MTNTASQPPAQTINAAATKRLFAQLTAFLSPIAAASGLTLRPFSLTTFTAMQLAGISVGSKRFADLSETDRQNQLTALLVIQTAPLGELKKAIRAANGDFQEFYWNYCFEYAASVPIEAMLELESQLAEELPAVEAAQVEIQTPPSLEAGKGEKTPGN